MVRFFSEPHDSIKFGMAFLRANLAHLSHGAAKNLGCIRFLPVRSPDDSARSMEEMTAATHNTFHPILPGTDLPLVTTVRIL